MNKLIMVAFALILAISLIAYACPAYAMVKTVDNKAVVDSREYPIIFIAGMGGSVLNLQGTTKDIWVGTFHPTTAGEWEDYKNLALKEDGKSAFYGTPLVAVETLKMGGVQGMTTPVYQPFYDYIKNDGYQLISDSKGNVYSGKAFFDFFYDFRQDNNNWVGDLEKKVDLALKVTRSEKVILVGHSMGGLLARLYMADENRAKKVAAVVFMGTPHHGSVMPFLAITNGYNFGNDRVTPETMYKVMANWAGGYQLLPDFDFLMDEQGQMHGLNWILEKRDWITEQEYKQHQKDLKAGQDLPLNSGFTNPQFIRDSLTFHQKIGDSVKPYPGVKYYMIEGSGQETVRYLKVRFEEMPDAHLPVLRLEQVTTTAGDGTVPAKGAEIKGDSKDLTHYTVTSEHMKIPGNAEALKYLNTIRAEVNNETIRKDMSKKIYDLAANNMSRVKPSAPAPQMEELSLAQVMIMLFISGTPEPEKIKLRDEIKNIAGQMVKDARANITITKGTDKNNPDLPDTFYIIVDNYVVKETGGGAFANPTAKVTVDTYDTAIKALKNNDELAKAYASKQIKVEGTGGIAQRLNIKIFEWINKYTNRKK